MRRIPRNTWSQGAWLMLMLARPVTLLFRMMLTSAARASARSSTDTSTLLMLMLIRLVGSGRSFSGSGLMPAGLATGSLVRSWDAWEGTGG